MNIYIVPSSILNSSFIHNGNQGDDNYKGIMNAYGAQGFMGNQGIMGEPGTTGNQGPWGPQGNQGDIGYQGIMGSIGFQGAIGVIGYQGNQGFGYQGTIGPQGVMGFQGFAYQGPQGPQGNQGPMGYQGFGYQGSIGNQGFGYQGPQGNQGVMGNQGTMGNQGMMGFQGTYMPVATTKRSLTSNTALTNTGYTPPTFVVVWPNSDVQLGSSPINVANTNDRFYVTTAGMYNVTCHIMLSVTSGFTSAYMVLAKGNTSNTASNNQYGYPKLDAAFRQNAYVNNSVNFVSLTTVADCNLLVGEWIEIELTIVDSGTVSTLNSFAYPCYITIRNVGPSS